MKVFVAGSKSAIAKLLKSKPIAVRYDCLKVTRYVSWKFQPSTCLRAPRRTRADGSGPTGLYSGLSYRLDPRVWHRERVLNPLRRAVVGEAIGISGEAAIDRRRVGQQVGAVRAGGSDRLDAAHEVRRGRPGRAGPHTVGPFRSLANEVSHWICVPLFTSAGVLLTTMLPSPPKGPSDL